MITCAWQGEQGLDLGRELELSPALRNSPIPPLLLGVPTYLQPHQEYRLLHKCHPVPVEGAAEVWKAVGVVQLVDYRPGVEVAVIWQAVVGEGPVWAWLAGEVSVLVVHNLHLLLASLLKVQLSKKVKIW